MIYLGLEQLLLHKGNFTQIIHWSAPTTNNFFHLSWLPLKNPDKHVLVNI